MTFIVVTERDTDSRLDINIRHIVSMRPNAANGTFITLIVGGHVTVKEPIDTIARQVRALLYGEYSLEAESDADRTSIRDLLNERAADAARWRNVADPL